MKKQIIKGIAITLLVVVFYFLSFGPVLRLVGAKVGVGSHQLPLTVQIIYAPALTAYTPLFYDDYLSWWVGGKKHYLDFYRDGKWEKEEVPQ
jgi:hypothetical protein